MFIEVLLARFTEQILFGSVLKRLPTLGATSIDTHHVPFGVVQGVIKKLGDDVRASEFQIILAEVADGHFRRLTLKLSCGA